MLSPVVTVSLPSSLKMQAAVVDRAGSAKLHSIIQCVVTPQHLPAAQRAVSPEGAGRLMTMSVLQKDMDAPSHPEQRDEAGHQLAVLPGADGGLGGRALIPCSRLRTCNSDWVHAVASL